MQFSRSLIASVFAVVSLTACVQTGSVKETPKGLTPEHPQAQQAAIAMSQEQSSQLFAQAATYKGPKLWFAGFGFHSGSTAFRGDVLLTESRLREQFPQTLAFKFDNALQQEVIETPFAHLGSLNNTVKEIAQHAKKGDVVTIMLSSHGYKRFLSTQIGGREYASIMDYHLATALAPLKSIPTILIISACHSGSLIPALKSDNRIILTASAESKVSYGCQPLAHNTFFIDALFGKQFDPTHSLTQEFEFTKKRIEEREKSEKFIASEPQIFIGDKMRAFASLPIKAWLSPAPAIPRSSENSTNKSSSL